MQGRRRGAKSLATEEMNSGLSFIKVISNSQKLDLPAASIPQLQGVLGRRVTLRNVDKKSWSVGVERGGDGYSFTKGWPQFYQDNSLKPDYVVLFTYKCKNLFDVKVFGHNAYEKKGLGRLELRVEEDVEEDGDEEDEDDDDDDDDDEDYVIEELESEEEETVGISKNRSKSHRFKTGLSSNHGSQIRGVEEDDEEEARNIAKAKYKLRSSSSSSPIQRVKEEEITVEDDKDDKETTESDEHDEIEKEEEINNKSKAKHKQSRSSSSSTHKKRNVGDYYGHDIFSSGLVPQPNNPYFVSRSRSRSRRSRKNELVIPKDVILNLNLNIPSKLILVDKSGKKWEAGVKKWKDGRVRCTSGWKRMCRVNNIGEDDTCICEFVQDGRFGLSMLVRAVDAAVAATK